MTKSIFAPKSIVCAKKNIQYPMILFPTLMMRRLKMTKKVLAYHCPALIPFPNEIKVLQVIEFPFPIATEVEVL